MPETKDLSISILPCDDDDFLLVKKFISDFSLDDTQLDARQFLIAKKNHEVIGFVRYKKYEDCAELCSLGVVENYRLKGVGSKLVRALLQKNGRPVFIVTIIPEFFTRFGFEDVPEYPESVRKKLLYCESSLSVPEKYLVMAMNS